ncbi:MAG: hypothetical protein AAB445_04140 [Patescibacteria group bacterium]
MPTQPPDDIFAKVDPASQVPPPARPTPPVVRPAAVQPIPQYTPARRWPILVGGGVVLVLGAGAIGFFALRKPATTNTPVTTNQAATNTVVQTTNSVAVQPTPTLSAPLDKDADGLTDDREQELGTSLTKADTDGDGLGDGEEVNVYTTDPKRPDTDGDGNPDGTEVKKGYNPKGSGLLLDLNVAKQQLQK